MEVEAFREIALKIFAVDSVGSVVLRGLVWLGVAVIILFGTRNQSSGSLKNLKASLGFFLMFIFLAGGLVYGLFGFTIQGTS